MQLCERGGGYSWPSGRGGGGVHVPRLATLLVGET